MTSARIPSWWVLVGAETAEQIEHLFEDVMADLPMSHRELAEHEDLDVDPSTVTRWAKGETTPRPETMLAAVAIVRERLAELLNRASVAEDALEHLVAAEEAEDRRRESGDPDAGQQREEEIRALTEIVGEM